MNSISRLKAEIKISEKIRKGSGCQAYFEYVETSQGRVQIIARTFNPKTEEIFVLTTVTGDTDEICLALIDKYIDTVKESESTYTVEWARKGDNAAKHYSYFAANDIAEVCTKFFSDKKKQEYIVYEIKMNPTA